MGGFSAVALLLSGPMKMSHCTMYGYSRGKLPPVCTEGEIRLPEDPSLAPQELSLPTLPCQVSGKDCPRGVQ